MISKRRGVCNFNADPSSFRYSHYIIIDSYDSCLFPFSHRFCRFGKRIILPPKCHWSQAVPQNCGIFWML